MGTSRTIKEKYDPYDKLEEPNAGGSPLGTWEKREMGKAGVEEDFRGA